MKKIFRNSRGLTMIEMLVVIAAIVIISGLLFPMFKKVRESGQKAKCLSNLRQLGVAISLYIQDDAQGRYPRGNGGCVDVRDLPGLLWRYIGQENESALWSGELYEFRCPSNRKTNNLGARTDGSGNQVDYSINCNLWGQASVAKLGNSSIAVVLYDNGVDDGENIHLDGANFLFADGHVQWITRSNFTNSWPNVDQYSGTKYDDWGIIP